MLAVSAPLALVLTGLAIVPVSVWQEWGASGWSLCIAVSALVMSQLSLSHRSTASSLSLWAGLAWPLLVGVMVALALAAMAMLQSSVRPMHLLLAPGVMAWCALLDSLSRIVLRFGAPAEIVSGASVVLFGACLGIPLWLAPWLQSVDTVLSASAVVAASPLSHLSVLIDFDYLRAQWFYRHSPLGGLRFDYPSPVAVVAPCIVGLVIANYLCSRTPSRSAARLKITK